MAKRWEFTVVGGSQFPVDMLRYDACWPRDPESVGRITSSLSTRVPRARRELQVNLISNVKRPTSGRWQSFGWYVVKSEEVKLI
jgi:hypothetical protein